MTFIATQEYTAMSLTPICACSALPIDAHYKSTFLALHVHRSHTDDPAHSARPLLTLETSGMVSRRAKELCVLIFYYTGIVSGSFPAYTDFAREISGKSGLDNASESRVAEERSHRRDKCLSSTNDDWRGRAFAAKIYYGLCSNKAR